MKKGSGLFLHISSLPSKYGVGNFGTEAKKFVKLLKLAGQKYWQVLPLNPTACNGSPYQSNSSFAINPYLIDLEYLLKKEYLTKEEIELHTKSYNNHKVDYDYLNEHRLILLKLAANRAKIVETYKIQKFYHKNKKWLNDYSLFMCLKEKFNNSPWHEWPSQYKFHKKQDLEAFKENNLDLFEDYVTIQYFAFMQYLKLKKYANGKDIRIVGELPFYMSYDSVDIWAHRSEFQLNRDGSCSLVAGKDLGKNQLYDLPLYDFIKMEKNNFKWWTNRIKFASKLYDLICIDDFQEFVSYYAVSTENNRNIEWKQGPRNKIVDIIKNCIKNEIIVKDYIVLTDDVYELIKYSEFIDFQEFGFSFNENTNSGDLPHNLSENCVSFMGFRNNKSLGVGLLKDKKVKENLAQYLHFDKYDTIDSLINMTIKVSLNSKANLTLFTVEDLLKVYSEDENWKFRFKKSDFKKSDFLKLYRLTCESMRY